MVFLLYCSVSLAEASGKTLPVGNVSDTCGLVLALDAVLVAGSAVQKTIPSREMGVGTSPTVWGEPRAISISMEAAKRAIC